MAQAYIVNADGTYVLIPGMVGSDDYTQCSVVSAVYSDDWQSKSQLVMTIKANKPLPVKLGARYGGNSTAGAGGYILLSPPTITRTSAKQYTYEFTFSGLVHYLENILLFNADGKGGGWKLTFSLVGTPADFLALICRNMNRTLPTVAPLETWAVGKVDLNYTLLISFDNDNCLTALRKVSEAFALPYRITYVGGFNVTVINIDLTAECRVHNHVFSIGSGLAKFKVTGDNDRPFASALYVEGGGNNIPYDYRDGVGRLQVEGITLAASQAIVYAESAVTGDWTGTLYNVVTGVTVDFASTSRYKAGTHSIRITPGSGLSITGQGIKFISTVPFNTSKGVFTFWVYLDSDHGLDYSSAVIAVSLGAGTVLQTIFVFGGEGGTYGFNGQNTSNWQKITIPAANFMLNNPIIDTVKIQVTGTWPVDIPIFIDDIQLNVPNAESVSFILDDNTVDEYGRVEAVAQTDEIYPRSNLSITSVVSTYRFIDTALFDLNAVDINGNTTYIMDGVTPKINFLSGNLAGYSFGIKEYNTVTHQVEIVPYTDESGAIFPSDEGAFAIQVGDLYNITEIIPPASYTTDAEAELLAWGNATYLEYSATNEVAEVELDPIWVKNSASAGLTYTLLGESPPVNHAINSVAALFKIGDLLTVTIDSLYSRELKVMSMTYEARAKAARWAIKLGNNKVINLAGEILRQIDKTNFKLNTTAQNLLLAKYLNK